MWCGTRPRTGRITRRHDGPVEQGEERAVALDDWIGSHLGGTHRLSTGGTDTYHSGGLLDTDMSVVSLTVPGSSPAVNPYIMLKPTLLWSE